MMGTIVRITQIRPVACPPRKIKKPASNSHHSPTTVPPTDCDGLLQATVKAFNRDAPSLSPAIIFNLDAVSLYLHLSLSKLPLLYLHSSTNFFPFSPLSLKISPFLLIFHFLQQIISLSTIFFSKFISSSPILHNHLFLSPILTCFSLQLFIFLSHILFLSSCFNFLAF